MEVLILSKTKYGATQFCVGGICIGNKQFIRLLNPGGYYQPIDTKFNIGDIWDITFSINTNRKEPHNEDVTIHTSSFVKKIYPLESYIKNLGVPIWKNSITNIFDGKILWQKNGKGYFSEYKKNYPTHSVGFWISDVPLKYSNGSYIYENNGITRQVVYKGNQTPLQIIPKGKLIRLSLAKWWKPEDSDIEARCYLQLSGWYDDLVEPVKKTVAKPATKPQQTFKSLQTPKFATPKVEATKYETPKYQPTKYETPKYEAPKYQKPKFEATKTPTQPKNTNGSCYIATLCYNDFYADEVCSFRDFRDITLNKTKLGKQFISHYYRHAPILVSKLKNCKKTNLAIKHIILNPLLMIIKVFKLDKR